MLSAVPSSRYGSLATQFFIFHDVLLTDQRLGASGYATKVQQAHRIRADACPVGIELSL